ncbi:MAG: hydrogenase, partial [Deltaproteobacteria bacterium]|nr:hydrogenase [Deltaproteobacteria bacterium]
AGGDVVTGPNTVVDAIAAGRKAASTIDRYLNGEALRQPGEPLTPKVYIESLALGEDELDALRRATPPALPIDERRRSFGEVERPLSEEDAQKEARRCLRCDLAFTQPAQDAATSQRGGRA